MYRRLTPRNRYQIELMKSNGASNAKIASRLNVARSTITRELRRCGKKYSAEKAEELAKIKSLERSTANRKITGETKSYVDLLLLKDLSPEQIEDVLCREKRLKVSFTSIYRYVERDKVKGGKLKSHLRILRKQRKDRKRPKYRAYQGLVKNRVAIDQRPKVVEKRCRIGDYERDTVHGKSGGPVLLTIVDRKTRYVHLACVARNSAELVHRETVKLLKSNPVKTITNDNGIEFAYHFKTSRKLRAPIYFSRSYRAWERGTNENTNGLLRQYFPKRTAIPMLSKKALQQIQDKLNKRPRKCLGFKTPHELYSGKPPGPLLR